MDSIGSANVILLFGALLLLAGVLSSLVATRFGAPMLLVFLLLGMAVGEDGPVGLAFSDYFSTYVFASLALAIILFDGGMRTRLANLRGVFAPALLLATIGVLVTAFATGLVATRVLALTPLEGMLMGAIVASTDAAAVFFLLRAGNLQLRRKVGGVLEIESGTNDPMAVFLVLVLTTLVLVEAESGAAPPALHVFLELATETLLGTGFGLAGGFLIAGMLNRIELPNGLHPLAVVATAVLTFATAALSGGSGFLAVYIAGLVVGNRPVRAWPAITGFHDALTWLCQIVMFLMLGLLVTPTELVTFAGPAGLVAGFLIVIGRPLAVALCLWPFGLSARDTLFVAWVGLRGAVSIFLAAIPTLAGVPHAELYFNVAFFVVLLSLLVQGWTVAPLARRLGAALRTNTPSITRVELDLPGQVEQELVGYPIASDRQLPRLGALPDGVRTVMVVRDGVVLTPDAAGPFRAGDYVYLLTAARRVQRLDRLFGESNDGGSDHETFGEFVLRGEAALGQIAELYGLDLRPEQRAMSVADYFAEQFEERVQAGDRLPLGTALLVARVIREDRVARAGLQLAEFSDMIVAASRVQASEQPRLPTPLAALAAGLRRWRQSHPGKPPVQERRDPGRQS